MKKIMLVFLVLLSLGLVVGATSYNKANVSNRQKLRVVPNSGALIGVTTDTPISESPVVVGVDAGQQEMQGIDAVTIAPVTEVSGAIRITNRSANDICVKSLRCTATGYSVHFDYNRHISSGTSIIVDVTVSSGLPAVSKLPCELKVEWVGGNAKIDFDVDVDHD